MRKISLKKYAPSANRNRSQTGKKKILTPALVREINKGVIKFPNETAGDYRRGPVVITNSNHTPPAARKVPVLVRQCMAYITRNWERKPPVHLAAYALWRLGWIHPFGEGNGRTARAVCLTIIALKYGASPPENSLMPKKNIRGSRKRYYAALREADEHFRRAGEIDVSALDAYLKTLLFRGASRALLDGT